jgi:hypothetical protein
MGGGTRRLRDKYAIIASKSAPERRHMECCLMRIPDAEAIYAVGDPV